MEEQASRRWLFKKPSQMSPENAFEISTIATTRLMASSCGICKGETAYPLEERDRAGRPLRVVMCSRCGVVHNHPIPSEEELSRFYAAEYRPRYKGTKNPRLRHAARYFPQVAAHVLEYWPHYAEVRHVLDVGSGSGEFLYLMQAMGKTAQGLEPSLDYAAFCRQQLGLEVATGEISSFTAPRAYDHIRLSHVVEHLRSPAESLRRVAGWLRDGGTLYIEVPDFHAYCRTKKRGGLFHFGHIYTFDEDSFDRMLATAGLAVVRRAGPTAAFVAPAPEGASQPEPVPRSVLTAKAELYAMHKAGRLQERSQLGKLLLKMRKRCGEYRLVAQARDYAAIGTRQADSLKKHIGRIYGAGRPS